MIAAGQLHTCAARASGEAACWGDNNVGQLGTTNFTDQPSPVAVRDPLDASRNLGGVLAVAGGGTHSCAFDSMAA